MKCAEFEALWILQEDAGSREGERERMREHAASCASCAEIEARMGALEVLLEDLAAEPVEAPPYLKSRVLAQIEETVTARRWSPLRLFTARRLMAVSLASLAFFAGLLAREVYRLNEFVRANPVQQVVLQYQAPEADHVQLVGDFNGWGRADVPLRGERQDGQWVFRLDLQPGRYQYAFVVDGQKWLPDPNAPGIIPDGFGGMNSILHVRDGNRPVTKGLQASL